MKIEGACHPVISVCPFNVTNLIRNKHPIAWMLVIINCSFGFPPYFSHFYNYRGRSVLRIRMTLHTAHKNNRHVKPMEPTIPS